MGRDLHKPVLCSTALVMALGPGFDFCYPLAKQQGRSPVIRAVILVFLTAILSLPAGAQEFRALARVIPGESYLRDAGQGAELGLSLSQAVPFRVFTMNDPMRVVVDFREVAWDGLAADFNTATAIAGVQTGAAREAGWSRMVLDISAPMGVDLAAMATDDSTGAAQITITLSPRSANEFSRLAQTPADLEAALQAAVTAPDQGDDRFVVVIDPGHGGVDPGAVRGEHTEADLVLTFARELRDILRRTGRVEVFLTRDSDVFVPLPTRLSLARAAGADAFISIHADAIAEGRAQGATVYTLSETASDAASAALAEQHDRADLLAGIDLHGADDVVAGVLMDLARTETAPRANDLAEAVVTAIGDLGLRLHSRPRMEAGFTVLKAADIPSVLVEVGFMSDDGDLENLLDPVWRTEMQDALRAAILDWADTDAARRELVRQ